MQSFPSGGSRSVTQIRSSSESERAGWGMLRARRRWHSTADVVTHSGSLQSPALPWREAELRLPSPSADVALEGSALQLLRTGVEFRGKQCSRIVNKFVK